ncbi:MAG: hypothetical protein WBD99_06810 [Thermodesulfobacteriota bacterium]
MFKNLFFILTTWVLIFLIGFLTGGIVFSEKAWQDFLTDNSGLIVAFATLLLVCVTGVYVYFTRRLVLEQTRPRIAVSLRREFGDGGHWFVAAVIKNGGFAPAYNINFDIDPPDFEYQPNKRISDYEPLSREIKFLAQGQQLRFRLQEVTTIKRDSPSITINAKYKDGSGALYKDKSVLSYNYIDSEFSLSDAVSELSLLGFALEEIKNAINGLRKNFPYGK